MAILFILFVFKIKDKYNGEFWIQNDFGEKSKKMLLKEESRTYQVVLKPTWQGASKAIFEPDLDSEQIDLRVFELNKYFYVLRDAYKYFKFIIAIFFFIVLAHLIFNLKNKIGFINKKTHRSEFLKLFT